MTYEDSQRIMRRIKRKEQEFGYILILASLCAGAIIAYVLL